MLVTTDETGKNRVLTLCFVYMYVRGTLCRSTLDPSLWQGLGYSIYLRGVLSQSWVSDSSRYITVNGQESAILGTVCKSLLEIQLDVIN